MLWRLTGCWSWSCLFFDSFLDDVELPALLSLAFGPELPVTDDAVVENVVAWPGTFGRALSVPFERGELLGPKLLLLVGEGVEFLRGRDSSDALLVLELQDGVFTEKLEDSLLELLVLRPDPTLLRMVHGLEAERVSRHEGLPVHNPLLRGA